MSNGQPKSPQAEKSTHQEPIKYGDVFKESGDLASNPISPHDSALINEASSDGQVLGKRVEYDAPMVATGYGSAAIDGDPITIGEALEAVVVSVGDKPVDQSDAAAISAAEIRATGDKNIRPDGVGAVAQSAATLNSHVMRREDMTRLSDVLMDATEKLPVDKAVTKEDAKAVYAAEVQFPWRRDGPEVSAEPGGVAASMATAADLNKQN